MLQPMLQQRMHAATDAATTYACCDWTGQGLCLRAAFAPLSLKPEA
jgi:hypothetical protein